MRMHGDRTLSSNLLVLAGSTKGHSTTTGVTRDFFGRSAFGPGLLCLGTMLSALACTGNGNFGAPPAPTGTVPEGGGGAIDARQTGDLARPDSAGSAADDGSADAGANAQAEDASAADALGDGAILCGNNTCNSIYAENVVALPACCVASTGACGSDVSSAGSFLGQAIPAANSCQPKGQPGMPDPTCPTNGVGVVALAPCCKPTGHCGFMTNDVLGRDLGLGCVDLADLGVSQDGGATHCNYGGGPAAADAAAD